MNNLNSLIERKRAEMYAAADKYGISNEKTIAISQELDKLLNTEQRRRLCLSVSYLGVSVVK